MNSKKFWIALGLFVMALAQTSFAQGLNWEGQTGALLTPFAYTASSPANKFGKPEVSFHYLNSGAVFGNDFQLSITEGVAKRFEFGYTAAMAAAGRQGLDTPVPSFMVSDAFNEFHGKLTVVDENLGKKKWVPAIAVGAIGRFGEKRLTWYASANDISSPAEKNGDFYVVATKTVTQVKGLPFVLSFGEKVTNASVFGVAGNAPHFQGRLFGAAAFVVNGPKKSALIFGSEAVQQPKYAEGFGKAVVVPTSLSYFVRVVPHLEGSPLQVDLGVAQLAGKVAPGVDLRARARVGMGISYHF